MASRKTDKSSAKTAKPGRIVWKDLPNGTIEITLNGSCPNDASTFDVLRSAFDSAGLYGDCLRDVSNHLSDHAISIMKSDKNGSLPFLLACHIIQLVCSGGAKIVVPKPDETGYASTPTN